MKNKDRESYKWLDQPNDATFICWEAQKARYDKGCGDNFNIDACLTIANGPRSLSLDFSAYAISKTGWGREKERVYNKLSTFIRELVKFRTAIMDNIDGIN